MAELFILFMGGVMLGLFFPKTIVLILVLLLISLVGIPKLISCEIPTKHWKGALSVAVAMILVQIPIVSTFLHSFSKFLYPRH